MGYTSRTYKTNRALILSGNPRCALCGLPGADTADHIRPISKGGTDYIDNLRPAHRSCNGSRGNRARTRYAARW